MKRATFTCLFPFLLALLAGSLCKAQTVDHKSKKSLAIERELMQIEMDLAKGTVNLDPGPYDRYWADDFIGVSANGSYTKASHRAVLTGGKIKFVSLEIDEMTVHVFGDAAIVTNRHTVKGHFETRDISGQSRVTSVFVRRHGHWQKVSEHTSAIPQK